MRNAVKVLYNMQEDTGIREAAGQREKSLFDMYSNLTSAERRGRKQGLEEGRAEGILIGRNEGREAAEQEFAVERVALLSEIAGLKELNAVQ